MNTAILIANILTFLSFFIHTFVGDRELKINEPKEGIEDKYQKREKWTMARSAWHWVSIDLLFATIGLAMINFTDYFENEATLLQILAIYFFAYAVAWLSAIIISQPFPKNYLKLGQWILLLGIACLIQSAL